MDEVDIAYKNQIIDALNSCNVVELTRLVPAIEEDEAEDYVSEYARLSREIIECIKAGLNTDTLTNRQHEMQKELMNKSHLSGVGKM